MRRARLALRLLAVILMVTAMGVRGLSGSVLMPQLDRATPATHGSSGMHHHGGTDAAAHHCHDCDDETAPAGHADPQKADPQGADPQKAEPHNMGSACGACGVCNAVTTQEIVWHLRSDIFRGPAPTTDVAAFTGGRPGLVKPPPIASVR